MRKMSLTKVEKIELVRRLNLNTEVNIIISSDNPEEIDKLERFMDHHNVDRVSIRTQSNTGEIKTPHYPIVVRNEVFAKVRQLIKDNFTAIVATPIDPIDCSLAGAIMKDGHMFHLEFAIGPYTVRRVTHDGIIDINLTYNAITKEVHLSKPFDDYYGFQLITMINICKRIPFNKCIIELSHYKIPVGVKKEPVIIWDIDSTGEESSTTGIKNFFYNIPRI